MRKELKTFIGGSVIGIVVGALLGGFVVASIGATMFINYSLNQAEVEQTISQLK